MRRPQFATLMTFRKPMWHHTKIKRLIQEIKNHVYSVWMGSILHEPLCVYRETCCQEMGMKLFSNMALYCSLVTVSSKKKMDR